MSVILYSFRRCPYAMRARLAIAASGVQVELREVLLRDKAPEFLAASPSATVPCLQTPDAVIDESLDIMKWALRQCDPEGWLDMPEAGHDLIAKADGPFKKALDHTKYAVRHPDKDPEAERAKAHEFLHALDAQLTGAFLFNDTPSLADMAILPFVRQFANIDKPRFDAQPWPNLSRWLEAFVTSEAFARIMSKYPMWKAGDPPTFFLSET
ncbi:glutathione S-transferase [Cognatishimia sp. SS12]|uniref:glutathione S-transferase n=1 Tax=Cognatishimia sp. SS12 TaxID=2979465 RepID=UPI00233025FB|nr:glutathione S-transferase [Cognatishimia sp. SS12]MDC0737648.1 glutathione S-transferase [Cognatishimia sp. SS12]